MIVEVLRENNEKIIVTHFPTWVKIDNEGQITVCLQREANCIYIDDTLFTINGRYLPPKAQEMKLEPVFIGMCNEETLLTEERESELFKCFIGGDLQAMQQFKYLLLSYVKQLSKEEKLKVPCFIESWYLDTQYFPGDVVAFGENSVGEPQLYSVKVKLISKYDEYPPEHPELYEKLGVDEKGVPLAQPCFGKEDSYSKGDIVNINGKRYKSLIDDNPFIDDVPWFNDVWEEAE